MTNTRRMETFRGAKGDDFSRSEKGIMRSALAVGLLLVSMSVSSAAERPIVFRRATVETAAKAGKIEKATLVVRDGKIEAVAADAPVPDDAKVIDAAGKTILPGFIDPFWTPSEPALAGGGRGIFIDGQIINLGGDMGGGAQFVRMAEDFVPYDRRWKPLVREGLTHIHYSSANYGQGALIRLNAALGDEMLASPDGLLCVSVSNDSASLDRIRTALEQIDRYKKGTTGAAPATPPTSVPIRSGPGNFPPGGRQGGGPSSPPGSVPSNLPPSGPPTTPAGKLWLSAYEGKTPVLVRVDGAAAVSHLLRVAEPYKDVKWVLAGLTTSFIDSAEKIKGKPIKVVLRPAVDRMPHTRNRLCVARLLNDAGNEIIFTHVAATPAFTEDMPLFAAAMAVKGGLPRQTAIEAMTIRPAALLGIDKTHGSLEAGKSASFVVFDGDPFEADSRIRQVYVEGKLVHEN